MVRDSLTHFLVLMNDYYLQALCEFVENQRWHNPNPVPKIWVGAQAYTEGEKIRELSKQQ